LTRRFHGARGCGEVICPRPCRQVARTTGIRPLKPPSMAVARSWEGSSRSSTLNPLLLRRRRPVAARRPAERPPQRRATRRRRSWRRREKHEQQDKEEERRTRRCASARAGVEGEERRRGPDLGGRFTFSRWRSWLRRRQDSEESRGAREQRRCREHVRP
jgi:hypothetical protein